MVLIFSFFIFFYGIRHWHADVYQVLIVLEDHIFSALGQCLEPMKQVLVTDHRIEFKDLLHYLTKKLKVFFTIITQVKVLSEPILA